MNTTAAGAPAPASGPVGGCSCPKVARATSSRRRGPGAPRWPDRLLHQPLTEDPNDPYDLEPSLIALSPRPERSTRPSEVVRLRGGRLRGRRSRLLGDTPTPSPRAAAGAPSRSTSPGSSQPPTMPTPTCSCRRSRWPARSSPATATTGRAMAGWASTTGRAAGAADRRRGGRHRRVRRPPARRGHGRVAPSRSDGSSRRRAGHRLRVGGIRALPGGTDFDIDAALHLRAAPMAGRPRESPQAAPRMRWHCAPRAPAAGHDLLRRWLATLIGYGVGFARRGRGPAGRSTAVPAALARRHPAPADDGGGRTGHDARSRRRSFDRLRAGRRRGHAGPRPSFVGCACGARLDGRARDARPVPGCRHRAREGPF